MGYVSILARCGGCDRTFSANPSRVPCWPVNLNAPPGFETRLSRTGTKEPFCQDCANAINDYREAHGHERLRIPSDAYEAEECQ